MPTLVLTYTGSRPRQPFDEGTVIGFRGHESLLTLLPRSHSPVLHPPRLLDDLFTCKCDEYRRCYANILYRWDLLPQRAEVLKFQVTRREGQMKIGRWHLYSSNQKTIKAEIWQYSQSDHCISPAGFSSLCRKCGELVTGPSCKKSKCFAFTCSICNLAVRGNFNFGSFCGSLPPCYPGGRVKD